jgi:peptidoglycan L-alanyl-D-glutamate endopeptidase CwlK
LKVVRELQRTSEMDFAILEGMRTLARQKQLFAKGASTTMRSRHLTGHAVDIAPYVAGQVRWDWPLYHTLALFVKKAAITVSVPIDWGGDWKTFKDGPHWQLPWKQYP